MQSPRWGSVVAHYAGSVEEATARACMRRAYELGRDVFDTANVYAGDS